MKYILNIRSLNHILIFKEIQEHPNRQCNMPRKRSVVKPILHRSFDYRCEIDLIDKELNSDNDYKLIIEYEDNYSTFVINRPLRCKRANDIYFIFLYITDNMIELLLLLFMFLRFVLGALIRFVHQTILGW